MLPPWFVILNPERFICTTAWFFSSRIIGPIGYFAYRIDGFFDLGPGIKWPDR
jgi:hypothetical protein